MSNLLYGYFHLSASVYLCARFKHKRTVLVLPVYFSSVSEGRKGDEDDAVCVDLDMAKRVLLPQKAGKGDSISELGVLHLQGTPLLMSMWQWEQSWLLCPRNVGAAGMIWELRAPF